MEDTLEQGIAELPDGTRLSWQIAGPENGMAVALVHSLAMDGTFWGPVRDELVGEGCRVLTFDCRGHGASAGARPFTVEQFADDLEALAQVTDLGQHAVAGASMGGCVALAHAIRHPGSVRALGLIDTTAWYGETAPADWEGRARKALAEGLDTLIGFQQERWFSGSFREARPEVVQAAIATFQANDPEDYAAACRMLGSCDLRDGLPGIRVPTAIVVGEEDYATPVAMAEVLKEGISGSALTVLQGKRHLTPLEAPREVTEALLAAWRKGNA
jgi:3-oxoadipate enol-lactonase